MPFNSFEQMISIGKYKKMSDYMSHNTKHTFPSHSIILLANMIRLVYNFERTNDITNLDTSPRELFNITHRGGKKLYETFASTQSEKIKGFKENGFLENIKKRGYAKVNVDIIFNIRKVSDRFKIPTNIKCPY